MGNIISEAVDRNTPPEVGAALKGGAISSLVGIGSLPGMVAGFNSGGRGGGGGGGGGGGMTPQSLWNQRPERQGIADAGGNLKMNYEMTAPNSRMTGLQQDFRGINNVGTGQNFNLAQGDIANMRDIANSTTDSPWALAARQKLAAGQAQGRDAIGNQSAAGLQGAMGRLGASGGYGGGARERMAQSADRSKMNALQGLHRTGQMGGAQIGMQDAGMKSQMMQNLPGMSMGLEQHEAGLNQYNNQLGMDKAAMKLGQGNLEDKNQMATNQWNISNRINDKYQGNDWNMNQWMQHGNLAGATATSNAMMNSANKQGFNIMDPSSYGQLLGG